MYNEKEHLDNSNKVGNLKHLQRTLLALSERHFSLFKLLSELRCGMQGNDKIDRKINSPIDLSH